jgi:uracil-DNA glycosylase
MLDKLNKQIISCVKCKSIDMVINLPQPGYFNGDILVVLQNPGMPANDNVQKELEMRDDYEQFKRNYKNTIKKCYMGKFISSIFDDWDKISITNIVKCPTKCNQMPNEDIITNCQNYVFEQIKILKPKIILCVGNLSRTIIPSSEKYIKLHIPHYSYFYRFNLDVDKYTSNIKNNIKNRIVENVQK